jgi:hypothetical protein
MVDVGQSPDPPSGQQPKSLSTRTSTSRCTLDKNHLYSSSTSTAPPSSALASGGTTPIIDDDNRRISAAPTTATAHSTRTAPLDAASQLTRSGGDNTTKDLAYLDSLPLSFQRILKPFMHSLHKLGVYGHLQNFAHLDLVSPTAHFEA